MTYLSWAVLYEGETDAAYFDVLIPRIMGELVMARGIRHSDIPLIPAARLQRDTVANAAERICQAKDAFHLIFIHADTGGRNLEAGLADRASAYCKAIHERCEWPPVRCITITPRHETEAWILADPQAVTSALGYAGSADSIGLPADANHAERLADPKAALAVAVREVRGKRRQFEARQIWPAIAQRQSLVKLRQSRSFASFETRLLTALGDLGCV